jgi:ATP-dependent Zn protease
MNCRGNRSTSKSIKMRPFGYLALMLSPAFIYGLSPPSQQRSIPVGLVTNLRTSTGIRIGFRSKPTSSLFSVFDDDRPQEPRKRIQKFILSLRKAVLNLAASPQKFVASFKLLSRRAKTLVAVQLLMMLLIIGSMGRTIYVKNVHMRTGSAAVPVEVPYSSFLDLVEKSSSHTHRGINSVVVDNVRIGPERMVYRLTKEGDSPSEETEKQMVCYTQKVPASQDLIDTLRRNGIPFSAAPRPRANSVAVLARTVVLGFYMLILYRMYKTFSGNAGSGDEPGKLASASSVSIASFNDIQGIDEAKNEVMELVDTLRNPEKYAILGARAPTGLLLEGPPGTGKTMLARATAASAGVPLIYASGSDFVEMFVGRGAARVRKLFERANRLAPAIIFIDELDALGKARDSGNSLLNSRGNDEAEQTLNQLLACMDGLDSTRRVCVLAATNRREVLDSALIRPGRFDRIVNLSLPDARGRENILRVHAKKLPGFRESQGVDDKRPNSLGIGDAVDLSAIAAVTGGFSGAELEYLVNEAAIRAVRRVSAALREGRTQITPHVRATDFEESLDSFFASRRPKGSMNDIWKNVWRSAA